MAFRPFANLPLKLVSLLVAGVLWLAVSGQSTVERNVQVPIEYRNVPEGMEIVGDPPGTVDVRLRGSSGNLGRVVAGDVVAALDLTNARPGMRIFNLQPTDVRVPFGVEVVQVTPPTVSLDFEYSGQKVVPVSPVIEGDPAPGFVIGRITTSPATVEVLGPVGRLGTLREATTEPVRVDGARSSVQDRVTIGVEDRAVRLREPQNAVVTVEVLPEMIERKVAGVVIQSLDPPAGATVRLTPARVTVVIRGPRDRLEALDVEALRAEVDLTGRGRGRHEVDVRPILPDGLRVERVEPAQVTAVIR